VIEDFSTIAHLAGVALGVGTVVFVTCTVASVFFNRIDDPTVAILKRAHGLIALSLVLLWVSGILLVGLRTGFDLSAFSPKLFTKLAVVVLLTLDATVIARAVVPLITSSRDRRLADLNKSEKALIVNCASISAASWMFALMLGSSSVLKTAEFPILITVGALIYGCAYAIAITVAVLTHGRQTGIATRPIENVEQPSSATVNASIGS
jgi:hypothetical protein